MPLPIPNVPATNPGQARRHLQFALALSLAAAAGCLPHHAQAKAQLNPADRRALLAAVRPQATERAGQPVKFKVHRLNVDGRWALLMGELVSKTGAPLDWRQARECHLELDKGLWVLLERPAGRWQVRHLEICATEPPHWTLEQFGGMVWPCGVYAGLQSATGDDLQAACLRQPAQVPNRPATETPR